LVGESGTGKEMAARLVHEASGRAPAPFVPVCCADISEATLESKYFGHAAGAIPGSDTFSPGLLEQVGTGTLFLDEVCEMHPKIQTVLTSVIQDGDFRPWGEAESMPCLGRAVAAAIADTEPALNTGQAPRDVYYLLQNAQIEIPPLRKRVAEILPLAEH